MTDEGTKELARRLATALGSYRAGNRRMDYFYQRYLEGREPGSFWIELAGFVHEAAFAEQRNRIDRIQAELRHAKLRLVRNDEEDE